MLKRLFNHLYTRHQFNRIKRFLRDRAYGRFSFSLPQSARREI